MKRAIREALPVREDCRATPGGGDMLENVEESGVQRGLTPRERAVETGDGARANDVQERVDRLYGDVMLRDGVDHL